MIHPMAVGGAILCEDAVVQAIAPFTAKPRPRRLTRTDTYVMPKADMVVVVAVRFVRVMH